MSERVGVISSAAAKPTSGSPVVPHTAVEPEVTGVPGAQTPHLAVTSLPVWSPCGQLNWSLDGACPSEVPVRLVGPGRAVARHLDESGFEVRRQEGGEQGCRSDGASDGVDR